ncbi:hypothetical protein [Desulfogranum marinum]|uniref:hypothetical protein n=1 Tax=Desulfogranum marinum TaxID=453220 RepID=UPI0029C80D0A|nr:hypothetical protein [Desulfogranum marinum]
MNSSKSIRPLVSGNFSWRHVILLILIFGSLLWLLSLPPIAQNTEYHLFADTRNIIGIPNGFNVVSNLPFLTIGILGLRFCMQKDVGAVRHAWTVFFAGVGLVSVGSAYYHLNPTNDSLAWDRLLMTIGFMGLFVALLGEYIDNRLATLSLAPAVIIGLASVMYWHWTDDLRPYLWVQLVPLLTIPAVITLFQKKYSHQWLLLAALGWYILAKVAEFYDIPLFRMTQGFISGHSLKHLLAAVSCYSILLMLQKRKNVDRNLTSEHK